VEKFNHHLGYSMVVRMNKTDMLVKRIQELTDESKRNGVWESLNEEIKDAVKTLINKLGVKSNG